MAMTRKLTVEEIIQKTVIAQRVASERQGRDVFKATEKRLYAYPVIKEKIRNDKERLEEIKTSGAPAGRKDIIRYMRSGQRLSPEDIQEALIIDLSAEIARNEHEIETIEKALSFIECDSYSPVVKYKYFDCKNDEEIADLLHCDITTAWRNKNRLVKRLSVFLYGSEAVL
jgi:DNA-directed RNA polymerase specialized sigma24 family protein